MTTLTIRRAGLADAADVAGCVHALLDELSDGKAPEKARVQAFAEEVLASDRVVAVLAMMDDTPVGVLTLNECMAIYAGGRFGEISELYIRPPRRSEGIAGQLLRWAVAEGRARGWKRLEVGAPAQPQWQRTLAFYRANGFEEVGPRLRLMI